MTPNHNQREYQRRDLKAPMVYAYQDSDLFYQARMCNYGKGGMCFESDSALEAGSDIYIMMENFFSMADDAEFYDGYLAEVRWCRLSLQEDVEQFKVGVKYYQTTIK